MVGEELVIFLSRFFEKVCTKKSYWESYVLPKLTYPQRQSVSSKKITDLSGLDLSSLLRLFDRYYDDISQHAKFDSHTRTLAKFVAQIRNDYAHGASVEEPFTLEEYYRFFDVIYLFLKDLKAQPAASNFVYENKTIVLDRLHKEFFGVSKPKIQPEEIIDLPSEENLNLSLGKLEIKGPFDSIETKISDLQSNKSVPATSIPWTITDNKKLQLTIHLCFLDDPGDNREVGQVICVARNNSSSKWDYVVNRLRIGIYVLDNDHLYMQIKTAVKQRNQKPSRKNLPIVDMDSKSGLNIEKILKDSGAVMVGTQESIGGPINKHKNFTCVSFRKDDFQTPIVAYVASTICTL